METLVRELNIRHELRAPLGQYTWYGVGGAARVLAHPSSVQQLASLVSRCHEQHIPLRVLGSGANLLVADEGVDAMVVKLDEPHFKQVRFEEQRVIAGAGYDLMDLVRETAHRGLGGLEGLAGIPASVGGAVRMNAGGQFGEIGAVVARVQVMDGTGHVYYRDRDDLVFAYRKSNIVAPFILEAEFELTPEEPEQLMRQVKEIFFYKKTTQPMGAASAGCAFKNPQPDAEALETNPHLGHSAGKLIDLAGLKGYRIGGAEVSTVHANFMVAHAGCKANDLLELLQYVEQVVQDRFGVKLAREVVVWR